MQEEPAEMAEESVERAEERDEASKLRTPLEQRAKKLRGLLSHGSPSKHHADARAAASSCSRSCFWSCFWRFALHTHWSDVSVQLVTPLFI